MLAPSAALSAVMTDYLKYRALHQGSTPGSVEPYERTYRSLLAALPHDTPPALRQEAVHKLGHHPLVNTGCSPVTLRRRSSDRIPVRAHGSSHREDRQSAALLAAALAASEARAGEAQARGARRGAGGD